MDARDAAVNKQDSEDTSKMAQKSANITMTLIRATQDTEPGQTRTSEREQSAAKKSCSVRKQNLLAFFGKGAGVPPPSTEGTPVKAVKHCRTPKSGDLGSKKKKGDVGGDETIHRKK
jgi:hypothetical protein